MKHYLPMLASPMKGTIIHSEWVAEEKYDGHRILVRVANGVVSAVSRDLLPRVLPAQIHHPMACMPDGVYDGELLVPGKRSYGVTELTNQEKLQYFIFDLIESNGIGMCHLTYEDRRMALTYAYDHALRGSSWAVHLASVYPCISAEQLTGLVGTMWAEDKEGLIIKKKTSQYTPGRRSKEWIKLKALRSDVLTIVGFQAGKNGPYSTVVLADGSPHNGILGRTTVKTKNMVELDRLAQNPDSFIGRQLRIEYQERTPDGNYRHPRWDRFEDE